jgi:hypothetical protein
MIIKILDNPVKKPNIREISYKPGASLKHYLKGIDLKNHRVIVSGKVRTNMRFIPKRHDEIIVAQNIGGPVWPILVLIGHAIWTAALAHPFIAWAFILSSAYSIYSFLSTPRAPAFNTGFGIDSNSPTYTWEGGRTIQDVGVPVPIVYGIHKLWGNIINQYQSTDGDNNYIHLLLLLCEGEMCNITDVKINDIAIGEYRDATYEIRLGTNDQTPVEGFDQLHDLNDINVKLNYNQPFIYTTKRDDVESFELYFSFPKGIYQS